MTVEYKPYIRKLPLSFFGGIIERRQDVTFKDQHPNSSASLLPPGINKHKTDVIKIVEVIPNEPLRERRFVGPERINEQKIQTVMTNRLCRMLGISVRISSTPNK